MADLGVRKRGNYCAFSPGKLWPGGVPKTDNFLFLTGLTDFYVLVALRSVVAHHYLAKGIIAFFTTLLFLRERETASWVTPEMALAKAPERRP